ncbi:MAG: hypothetical protein WDM76_04830 [Limisphaerales bacterium]
MARETGRNPANNDFNDNKEFAGRLFFQPFVKSDINALRGLGFGAGATYTTIATSATGLPNTTGGTLPGYSSPGQQQFFAFNPVLGTVQADGAHWRVAPQAYYYYGALGLLAEYTISHQAVLNSGTLARAELENTAWQVSAQWVLTGEPASFTGITPKRPFDPRIGQWGCVAIGGPLRPVEYRRKRLPDFLRSQHVGQWRDFMVGGHQLVAQQKYPPVDEFFAYDF